MPVDDEQAIGRLIKLGYGNDDIKGIVDTTNSQVEELVKQGKTNDEVKTYLSQVPVTFNEHTINPWANDDEIKNFSSGPMMKEDFGFATDVNANMQANQELQQQKNLVQEGFKGAPNIPGTGTELKDVKAPTAMQNIMSGPVGSAIESGLTGVARAAPFPGLIKLFTGQDVSKYGTQGAVLDPTPEIISDPIGRGIEGLKKVSPDFAKFIGDSMAASPAFFHFANSSLSNLSKYKGAGGISGAVSDILKPAVDITKESPLDLSNVRDVSPSANVFTGGTKLLESPRINDLAPGNREGPVSPLTPLESKPSAKLGQTSEFSPELPAETIEIAKYARDYGIKISNQDIITRANQVLDQAKVPENQRGVSPQQADLSRVTAIQVADEAKRHAENVGDVTLVKRANEIINNNGIIKTAQILNPSVHDLENFTADLNVIANNKPAADTLKLQGTTVVNPDGSPKELYHGTPVAFNEFDLAHAQPGLYGTGVYLTDSPVIAGGKGLEEVTSKLTGTKFRLPHAEFGYAQPSNTLDTLGNNQLEIWTKSVENYTKDLAAASEPYKPMIQRQLDYAIDQVNRLNKAQNPNVRPNYVNIKNPFDIDGPISIEEGTRILQLSGTSEETVKSFIDGAEWHIFESPYATGKTIYNLLDAMFVNKDGVNEVLKDAGYDGITHIGGGITGSPPHQVYIAFDPKQVISKFDPDLYSYKMADLVNNHYEIKNDKIVSVPNEFKELHDYSYLNTEWLNQNAEYLGKQQSVVEPAKAQLEPIDQTNVDAGMALVKRAKEVGINGYGAPTINNFDYETLLENVFERPRDIPPDNFGGDLPPYQDPFLLSGPEKQNLRGITWLDKAAAPISVFNKLEAESKIPFLTELHNTKQIADAEYTRMVLVKEKELKNLVREVGKYDKPTKENIEARKRISDILEEIQAYDPKSDTVFFKNKGAIDQGTPVDMSAKLKYNLDEVKVAARLRLFYDKAYNEGATMNAGQYLDFYNPKKMSEQQRFDYVNTLREDQRPFFQYPRTNRIYKTERDALTLANRYILEWARTKHLMPWQKETAEPIFELAKEAYKDSPRKNETLNYVGNYILDTLRMPRDTAMNANTAMFDFVSNWVKPKSPYLADAIFRRIGEDRLAEGITRGSNNFFLNYYLRFRPVPALRNMMQREFALPLLPGGQPSLIKAQYQLIRSKEAQDKALLSGLMPYLEGGLANTNKLDLFAHAESGNMHSPFLVIHDGVMKDFQNKMSLEDISDKWRLRFYPEAIQERFKQLYKEAKIGDIRDIGAVDNGAALLGRYASMITQFPKGPGETPEYARTGPVAKATWLFSTWTPMSIDYFSNLIKDAVYAPTKGGKVMDLMRIGKVFAYLYIADEIWEGLTGKSLQSNPITNLPNRVVQAPGPSAAMNLAQYLTSKWNEVANGMLGEDDKGLNKWLADQAWKNLTSSTPGAVKDFQYWTGANKKKEPKSIGP